MDWVGWAVSVGSGVVTAMLIGIVKIAHDWAKGLGERLDAQDDRLGEISDRLARLEGPTRPYQRR